MSAIKYTDDHSHNRIHYGIRVLGSSVLSFFQWILQFIKYRCIYWYASLILTSWIFC